jgi:hypothetical protein
VGDREYIAGSKTFGSKQMTRFIFIALCLVSQAHAQTSGKCNCGAIVDVNFKTEIIVYDNPNGRAVKTFRQDFKREDYLVLTIKKDSLDYFYVEIFNALTPEGAKAGWIKKQVQIGTFARNYEPNDTLFLYSKPGLKSKAQSFIPGWVDRLYTITRCYKD